MRVAIVADDLTGALDVCAPLAAHGWRCLVATNPRGIAVALAQGGDVVCVNTATREKTEQRAGEITQDAARELAAGNPEIVFKKIDSRLKGHVALEAGVCMAEFGRQTALIAPAIPDQGRMVRGGHVVGKGLDAPLDIAERLGDGFEFAIPDTASNDDLQALLQLDWRRVLLVGASGLSAALARTAAPSLVQPTVRLDGPLLLAIGSHDPVSLAQVERVSAMPFVQYQTSTDGRLKPMPVDADVTLYRADSRPELPSHSPTLAHFGVAIADRLRQGDIATALLCGGETAQTVLGHLGIDCVEVIGEALPGIAASRATLHGRSLTFLTKSGGFGTPDDLLLLAQAAADHSRDTAQRSGTMI